MNRGPDISSLALLPTLWFRNEWAWWPVPAKPNLHEVGALGDARAIHASHWELGERWLYVSDRVPLLFTDNETNNQLLFQGHNISDCVKDGINDYIVHGNKNAARCSGEGTKVAAHYQLTLKPGESRSVYLRLADSPPETIRTPFENADRVFARRLEEADEFYRSLTPKSATGDPAQRDAPGICWNVMEQTILFPRRRPLAERAWGHSVFAVPVEG